jgi:hypothetical protein
MALLFTPVAGYAATLDSTGAKGVDVNGTLYDVAFVDGSCIDLFSPCTSSSDFTFDNEADALDAAQALRDLFEAGGHGIDYDANPNISVVCAGSETLCLYFVPYAYLPGDGDTVESAIFANGNGVDVLNSVYLGELATVTDTSNRISLGYTVWTPTAAVPVPAGLPLLLTGFAGFVGLRLKKRAKQG